MSLDDAARSPRTQAKPMAFDAGEFAIGASLAVAGHLALFLILSEAASLVMAMFHIDPSTGVVVTLLGSIMLVLFVGFYALVISLIATVIGILPAFLLGCALVRVRSFRTHLLVWCAFGLVFAGAITLAVAHFMFRDQMSLMSAFLVTGFLSGAAAIPLAWARTASNALRRDRGLEPVRWFRGRSKAPLSPVRAD